MTVRKSGRLSPRKTGNGFVRDRGSSHPFEPTATARTTATAASGTAAGA